MWRSQMSVGVMYQRVGVGCLFTFLLYSRFESQLTQPSIIQLRCKSSNGEHETWNNRWPSGAFVLLFGYVDDLKTHSTQKMEKLTRVFCATRERKVFAINFAEAKSTMKQHRCCIKKSSEIGSAGNAIPQLFIGQLKMGNWIYELGLMGAWTRYAYGCYIIGR